MNILYLANIRMPSERANAVQVFHMCNGFSEVGAHTLLLASDRKTPIQDTPEDYYGHQMKFNLQKVWVPHLFFYLGPLFFVLMNLLFSIQAIIKFNQNSLDLYYCRDEWIVWFLSFFVENKKLVYESHEAKWNFPARRILKGGMKCVAISEGIQKRYIELGVEASNILVAHDGIDESFFSKTLTKSEACKRLGIQKENQVVMYIGGLEEWKGIEAFAEAKQFCPNTQFVVIGGKGSKVETLKVKYPDVTFLGSRPYNELPDNMQAADILVIPNSAKVTLSSEYTSPLKLFAYMTSGVPILASKIPSLYNVLGEGSVTYFSPDSPVSLAEEVGEIFSNYDTKKASAQELIEVSKKYTWKNRAHSILEFVK